MSKEVFLFGAGGHAKVVIDVLRRQGVHVVACLEPEPRVDSVGGIPVLIESTGLPQLRADGHDRAFVAIGDNHLRRRIATRARAEGLELINAISPLAIVAPDVELGTGILIVHGAIVNAASRIGDDTIVNTGATVDHDARIGAGVHIAPGSHLAGNVTVGSMAMLGIGTAVIPGITIGDEAVVGAGSVVIRDITTATRVWGNPAREQAPERDLDE
ncbi:MAG: perB [Frondihabitans sp.]|nr:perB [Frondihabitans sp.]